MSRGLLLAGVRSGCGKTSVTLGLLRALRRRGFVVKPFKAGPDFIDPGLHAVAAGRESHSLDGWMQPEAALRGLFARHAAGVGLALVEGAMGLFDGRGAGGEGSSAQLAHLLDLPVLLVLDAAGQARSTAAVALGFARFDPGLRLAGLILNRVAGERHAAILRQALADTPGLPPVLGCLPRREGLGLESRHLGLVTAQDVADLDERLDALADWVEAGLDLPALLDAAAPLRLTPPEAEAPAPGRRVRLGVARDRAFCFLYAENLRLLEAAGAECVFFSPLADAALPVGLDGLYLPGGYPELAARELAANASMRASVAAFCASGRPVWAECGGYMYLLESLRDGAGVCWPMCGALPGRAVLRQTRAALGYREARTLLPGPLGPAGTPLRGHEFHYSELEEGGGDAAFLLTASDGSESRDGQARGGVVAGYLHAHLASNPGAARAFVAACRG